MHKSNYNPDRQYGHLSNYKTAKSSRDKIVSPDSNTDCQLTPIDAVGDGGVCKAIEPRWFCNSSDDTCQQFNYGGCVGGGGGGGGNNNNFKTEFMCYTSCLYYCQPSGLAAPVYNTEILPPEKNHMDKTNYNPDCLLAPKRGWCRRIPYPRWFCNSGTGRCQQFLFSGCQGNGNNFKDENDCYNSCGHVCGGGGHH
ncbi:thrombin inhibitor hemalin-like [Oppia nitens]|uniref:thrombin inhibitor hemalin-like n=1 Tax=Oppia nitens TaxID=1686743 RepID=UPI0023D9EF16|nr:thrombin inhibitor hemalin-like [Oppia nitens]